MPLSSDEARALIAALPELSKRSRRGDKAQPWRVRDRFAVAWETGLRPATLDALRAPDDYQRGSPTLKIRREIDKARFDRDLPLTEAARAALDRCCPDVGLIFGRVDTHLAQSYLTVAAEAAGLDAEKVAKIKPYDLRHGRGTDLAERPGSNIVGIAYLFGHKAITTTNKYVHAHRAAAESVLGIGMEFGMDSPKKRRRGKVGGK